MLLRLIAFAALATVVLDSWPGTAAAQPFPNRPVRIVVPQPPGTASDDIARVLADQLATYWHQSVVIETRPGAGGTIAADFVAKSPADGHTLLLVNPSNMAIAAAVDPSLRYDPLADFTPIGRLIQVPYFVVANAALGVKSIPELIAYAKAHPSRVTYVSYGEATVSHMAFESLNASAGIDLIEVPYKTTAQSLPDLIEDRVDICLCDIAFLRPYIQAGTLRVLGAVGEKRTAAMPQIPTIAEQGVPGFDLGMWYGVVAPAGIPPAVRATLVDGLNRARRTPEMKQRIEFMNYDPIYDDPAQFAAAVRSEIERYSGIAKQARSASRDADR